MDEEVFSYPTPENEIRMQKPHQPSSRQYSAVECVYAWLCMFAGYLFCRIFPVGENPLGGFLLILFLLAAATVVLRIKGLRLGLLPVAAAVSAVMISGALILSANRTIRFFACSYGLVVCCYYIYAAAGNGIKKGFTDLVAADFFKALFVMPFYSLGHFFKAMFSGKAKNGGKLLAKILVGVGITAIPTTLVLALLSYDRGFSDLLERLFDFGETDIFSHVASILFGIPVGMYLFGLFISSVDRKCGEVITEDGCIKTAERMKIAPTATVMAAVLPLLFLYVVFFVSQWDYYVSGFTGTLPEHFSYAAYAREGFFQLCIVSVINLLVMASVFAFMRRRNKAASVLSKVLAWIFCAFTLVLIATALAKLFMYINCYGLTPKRVYAAWFMAVLAIVFLLIAVKQFVGRLQVVAAGILVFVVMFAALSLSNVGGYIAKYNVDRYLEGSMETVDVDAMEDLGLAGVPQMVRLANVTAGDEASGELHAQAAAFLHEIRREYLGEEQAKLFSWSVPYLRAKKALKTFYE